MKYPKSYKYFLGSTITYETICLGLTAGNTINYFENGYLNGDLLFVTAFAALAGAGMLVVEDIAFKEYKQMKKNASFVEDFTYEDKSKELETVAEVFYEYMEEKKYSYSVSLDILAKSFYELKRSGYDYSEIADYLIYLMYSSKDDKRINSEFKKIRKYKRVIE